MTAITLESLQLCEHCGHGYELHDHCVDCGAELPCTDEPVRGWKHCQCGDVCPDCSAKHEHHDSEAR